MERNDYFWVIVRGLGIYMIITAIVDIPYAVSFIFKLGVFDSSDAMSFQLFILILSLLAVVLRFAVGYYLLRNGGIFFKLLNIVPLPTDELEN